MVLFMERGRFVILRVNRDVESIIVSVFGRPVPPQGGVGPGAGNVVPEFVIIDPVFVVIVDVDTDIPFLCKIIPSTNIKDELHRFVEAVLLHIHGPPCLVLEPGILVDHIEEDGVVLSVEQDVQAGVPELDFEGVVAGLAGGPVPDEWIARIASDVEPECIIAGEITPSIIDRNQQVSRLVVAIPCIDIERELDRFVEAVLLAIDYLPALVAEPGVVILDI